MACTRQAWARWGETAVVVHAAPERLGLPWLGECLVTRVQKRQPQAGSWGGAVGICSQAPPPPPQTQAVGASPVNRTESGGIGSGPKQASPKRIGAGVSARMCVRRKEQFSALTAVPAVAGLLRGEACRVAPGRGEAGRRAPLEETSPGCCL